MDIRSTAEHVRTKRTIEETPVPNRAEPTEQYKRKLTKVRRKIMKDVRELIDLKLNYEGNSRKTKKTGKNE